MGADKEDKAAVNGRTIQLTAAALLTAIAEQPTNSADEHGNNLPAAIVPAADKEDSPEDKEDLAAEIVPAAVPETWLAIDPVVAQVAEDRDSAVAIGRVADRELRPEIVPAAAPEHRLVPRAAREHRLGLPGAARSVAVAVAETA